MMNRNKNNSDHEYQYLIMDDEVVFAEAEAALHENYGERDAEIVNEAEAALRENYGEYDAPLPQDRGTKRQVGGAAVAGGLAGLFLAGPVGCVVVAGGAALCATTRGQVGNVARASGDTMATVGDRLKKVDQKHHVVDKTSKGFVKGCDWVSRRLQPKVGPETRLTT
jgi:hypothetical protein